MKKVELCLPFFNKSSMFTVFLMAFSISMQGAIYLVTNLNDSGSGSLRDAVDNLAAPSGDQIEFNLSGTITLTSGQIFINKSLVIDGNSESITLNGNGTNRIFDIAGGNSVSIKNFRIENGNSGNDFGGGISSFGDLIVSNCIFVGNNSGNGGALAASGGTLYMINCHFADNIAISQSGAVDLFVPSTLVNCSFFNNTAGSFGGAIAPGSAGNVFTNCTFAFNTASISGGGIWNSVGSDLLLQNSIVFGNVAPNNADIQNDATLTASHNLIGNFAGSGLTAGTNNNITGIPNFVNAPFGDLALADGSLGINLGDISLLPIDINDGDGDINIAEVIDFDQIFNPRIVTCFPDLGAFENQNGGFVVTNTNDLGAGSLRNAITCTNNLAGSQTISFNIPGNGPHTITYFTRYDIIDAGTIVDGTTQPGFVDNPVIVLDGTFSTQSTSIYIGGENAEIYGLKLQNSSGSGIFISPMGSGNRIGAVGMGNIITNNAAQQIFISEADNCTIEGNRIGIDENGVGNTLSSVGIQCQLNADTTNIRFNMIGASSGDGNPLIDIRANSNNTIIFTNFIGTTENGGTYGASTGVALLGGENTTVRANTIANNDVGVSVFSNLNDIWENNFICNTTKAIELNGIGNNNQPSPIILTASPTEITGTALFNINFSDVEIYLQDNSTCPTAACQGSYVGVTSVQPDGTWTFTPATNFNIGDIVTAMSSISLANGMIEVEASELSACATVGNCNPDNDPPVFSNVPPDLTLECSDFVIVPPFPTAEDACDGDISANIMFNSVFTPLGCFNNQTSQDEWIFTVMDAGGNPASVSVIYTYIDTFEPFFTNIPPDLTIECSDALQVPDFPDAFDGCDGGIPIGNIQMTSSIVPLNCNNNQVRAEVFTFDVMDNCGNMAQSVSVTYTYIDTFEPFFTNIPPDLTIECTDIVQVPDFPEAFDGCDGGIPIGNIQMTSSIVPLNCNNNQVRAEVFTFDVMDNCGNMAQSVSVTYTYIDTQPPFFFSSPLDIVLNCGDLIPPAITPVDIIDCDFANITLSEIGGFDPSTCINGQTIVRTWTATDACGNASMVTQNISFNNDTDNPIFPTINPSTITVNTTTGNCSAFVQFTAPAAMDNCGIPITGGYTNDSPFATDNNSLTIDGTYVVGFYNVTFTVTDLCGNTATTNVFVEVLDGEAPVLNGVPADVTINCGDPYPTIPNVTATDNCDNNPPISAVGPPVVNGCNPAPTQIQDVYSWTAMDSQGNSSGANWTVTIINDLLVDLGDDVSLCNGSVTLDAGISNAFYEWSTGEFSETIEVTTAGTYSVTVTNANGCCNFDEIIINSGTPPNATAMGGEINCANGNVQLMGNSTTFGATYGWTGPDGFTSSDQNPTVSVTGDYILTVTEPNGCTNTAVATVTANNSIPNVSATGGTIDCNNPSVFLDGNSSTAGVTYQWAGPGGMTSSDEDPEVFVSGSYTLVVTAANGCTASATAEVIENLTIPFNLSAIGGEINCINTNIQLIGNSDDGGDTYAWTGPNGFTSSEQSPTVSVAGTYTLTVTGSNGCTADISTDVINNATIPNASATGGTLTCSNQNITLAGNSTTGGVTYAWTGPNGFTSGIQNPSVSVAGTYTVTVTSMNGCTASATATVAEDNAVPNATAMGGAVDCTNTTVQLMGNSSTAGVTYAWTGPNGFTSSDQNPIVSNAGNYTLTVTGSNGCTATATAIVTSDGNLPDVSATGGAINCIDLDVQLMGSSNTAGVTYSWTGPNGFTSFDQNPTVSNAGTYTLTVSSTNGCTASATAEVTANGDLPDVTTTEGTLDCNNMMVQLMGNSTTAGVTYAWTGPNGFTSADQNPTVSDAGTYTLTVASSNGCTAFTTAEVIDNGGAGPASAFTFVTTDLSVAFTDASTGGATSWDWDFADGGNTSMMQNPNYTFSTAGTYEVCLTVTNICGTNQSCQMVTVSDVAVGNFKFIVGTATGFSGAIINVPVIVEGFEDIIAFQKSIHIADPTKAKFVGTENYNLTDLDAPDFSIVNDGTDGNMTVVWFTNTPVTLTDGAKIYDLRIELLSTVDECVTIFIDGVPTPIVVGQLQNGMINNLTHTEEDGDACVLARVDISGNIALENGDPLDDVTVTCTGEPDVLTDANGDYEFFDLEAGLDYTVTPSRVEDPLDGVNAIDLALIFQHILGTFQLSSSYKVVAADVDISGSVNGADLLIIQQLIQTVISEYPDFNAWRFVDEKYTFTDIPGAAGEAFAENIFFPLLDRDTVGNDFVAVKLGDVDESAMGLQIPLVGDLNFEISETPSEDFTMIHFHANDFTDILAYQFDVMFDQGNMQFLEVIPGDLPGITADKFGEKWLADGVLTAIWYNQTGNVEGTTINEGDILFSLKFQNNAPEIALADRIQLGSSALNANGFTKDKEALVISTTYASEVTPTSDLALNAIHLYEAQPNPFRGKTTLNFDLPAAQFVQITIYDAVGKVVKNSEQNLSKGFHQIIIDGEELNGSGVYYYTFQAADFYEIKKLILQE
jgi:PKD repeat protein